MYQHEQTRGSTANAPPRRAFSIPQFCGTYSISRSGAYNEIAAGRLKIRKVGRRTLIAAEDAEAWFAACAVKPRAV